MQKKFVNALAYSRFLKFLMIAVLAFAVIVNIFIVFLVNSVIGEATPQERSNIYRLMVLLFISSAAGFPLFYFIHRGLKSQLIETDQNGISYNSLLKKVSASWSEVTKVSLAYGNRKVPSLRVETRNGKFHVTTLFVDNSFPIPVLRPGIYGPKLSYPDGKKKKMDIKESDVYAELEKYIPSLIDGI